LTQKFNNSISIPSEIVVTATNGLLEMTIELKASTFKVFNLVMVLIFTLLEMVQLLTLVITQLLEFNHIYLSKVSVSVIKPVLEHQDKVQSSALVME